MQKTGIIGFGNMGEAITAGLVKSQQDMQVTVYDKSIEKLAGIDEKYSIKPAASLKELLQNSDVIIIAVKPQDAGSLFADIAPLSKDKKIISIIAGRSIESIARIIDTDNICRFMPNLAAQYGKSFTAVSFNKKADRNFALEALNIARTFGSALILPETAMSAVTALSGSGIAFAFQFAHALSLGGVRAGIAWSDSLTIAASVLEGAAETLKQSGSSPADLIAAVSSPAGTTIEGLAALEAGSFNSIVMEAVQAAYEKAFDMENQ